MLQHIAENVSLKSYTTFGIDVNARYFAEVISEDQLCQLLRQFDFSQIRLLIMGGGSNMLFLNNFDGLVLRNQIKGLDIVNENDQQVYLKAGAGENWHQVVIWAVEHQYGGIENLSLIPGTAGAAPIQNIGAYGVELKDVFVSLEAIEIATGTKQIFNKEACHFGYRNSVFKNELKGKFIITSITLSLNKNPQLNTTYGAIQAELNKNPSTPLTVKSVSDAVIAIRKSKLPDPLITGNAGSFFKNPEIEPEQFQQLQHVFPDLPHYPGNGGKIKIAAGWLIEQCGWKGFRKGDAGCHDKQALVLVNYGNATGSEILQLARNIQESVYQKFNINIEPEVNIID
jgi:UDP-N-acetylmuramate dehydrogenase